VEKVLFSGRRTAEGPPTEAALPLLGMQCGLFRLHLSYELLDAINCPLIGDEERQVLIVIDLLRSRRTFRTFPVPHRVAAASYSL
jgi:hypothetical protein